eukprot:jgi/Chrzof1/11693/Cz06g05190.t1
MLDTTVQFFLWVLPMAAMASTKKLVVFFACLPWRMLWQAVVLTSGCLPFFEAFLFSLNLGYHVAGAIVGIVAFAVGASAEDLTAAEKAVQHEFVDLLGGTSLAALVRPDPKQAVYGLDFFSSLTAKDAIQSNHADAVAHDHEEPRVHSQDWHQAVSQRQTQMATAKQCGSSHGISAKEKQALLNRSKEAKKNHLAKLDVVHQLPPSIMQKR